jgi:AraC-like DNA-binding protein
MDPRYKLLLYCPNKNGCRCFHELVEDKFKISVIPERSSFQKRLSRSKADAAVICLTTSEKKLDQFRDAESFAGYMPVVSCTQYLEMDFVTEAVAKGVKRFIYSEMKPVEIFNVIIDAIKQNELKAFIEKKFPGCFKRSIYTKKIIDLIIKTFPQRINENEFSKELNISVRWLQKECKNAFAITYKKLLRIIWVYQAVRLLENTDFDNTYLAMQLNYKELSSMDRDFRKVLNLSPNKVRKKLSNLKANQLFEI